MSPSEKVCSIKGCNNPSVKTISLEMYRKSGLNLELKDDIRRKVHLCKEHYKEYKRFIKKYLRLERWRLWRT